MPAIELTPLNKKTVTNNVNNHWNSISRRLKIIPAKYFGNELLADGTNLIKQSPKDH
jgi:hypothetical protein